jgi:hypothetical protein
MMVAVVVMVMMITAVAVGLRVGPNGKESDDS